MRPHQSTTIRPMGQRNHGAPGATATVPGRPCAGRPQSWTAVGCLLVAATWWPQTVRAQTAAPTTRPTPDVAAAQPSAPPGEGGEAGVEPATASAARPRGRAPLLREGSHLLRAVGHTRVDDATGVTTLVIDPADDEGPPHELRLLPCMNLGEMDRMIQAAPGHKLRFEVSGQVLAYRSHNYLMLTHPPLMIGYGPEEPTGPPDGDPVTAEDTDTTAAAPAPTGDSVDAIIQDLQQAVGPVAHRPGVDRASPPIEQTRHDAGDHLVREGTVLLDRRGTIHRSPRGSFGFVFDADAEGLADPPMTLLPCLLLQRLERHARAAGEDAAVLISGRVYVYRGENYLLPTVYRVPYERTTLVP